MTGFKQANNENEGLSYYQSDFQMLSGLPPIVQDALNDPQFTVVTSTLYTKVLGSNLTTMQKAQMTINPSYIPDFVRDYMEIVSINQEAYTAARLDNYWIPAMQKKGYDPAIAKVIFKEFAALHAKGIVPQFIWMPEAKVVDVSGAGNGGGLFSDGPNWLLIGGIGVGILAVGGLAIALAGRR